MQGSDRALTEAEKDKAWQRRGKKYKMKYFAALKECFKTIDEEAKDDKDCQLQDTKHGYGEGWEENCCPLRGRGSDKAGSLGT